jgi:hypothetical protein
MKLMHRRYRVKESTIYAQKIKIKTGSGGALKSALHWLREIYCVNCGDPSWKRWERAVCIWLENGEVGCGDIMQEAVKGHAEVDKAM